MTSTVTSALVSDAPTALRLLNGVICIHKPFGWGVKRIFKEFRNKITTDLNQMKPPQRQERVEIRRVDAMDKTSMTPMENETVLLSFGDGRKQIEVVRGLSYSDHPLVSGNRYTFDDFKLIATGKIGKQTSGVHSVNKGIQNAQKIYHSRWLKTYLISGRFGIGTNTFFHTGRVLEKSTYKAIRRPMFERFLAATQSAHQRLSFSASGVPLDSDRAYELASQGMVRPSEASAPVIYSIKCTEFELPDFTLEVKTINEDEAYLMQLIHECGLKLRSTATCTKILCTNVGPFSLNEALLLKHWNVENVIENMNNCRRILQDFSLTERDLWVGNLENKELEFKKEPQDKD